MISINLFTLYHSVRKSVQCSVEQAYSVSDSEHDNNKPVCTRSPPPPPPFRNRGVEHESPWEQLVQKY